MASVIRAIKQDVASVKAQVMGFSTYGPVAAFFTFWQGRSTTFAILFSVEGIILIGVGIYGFFHHMDLGGYASFVLAMATFCGLIQTTMVAHSTKEDWMAIKQQQVNQQLTQTQILGMPAPPIPPPGSAQ
jgi:hypothetical protein